MQSPIIPYEIYRRYIYGSPYGRVSISGDVVGPTFIDEKPSRLERMFPDGNGRFGKGTEYHLFNLAANTWQLHYYRSGHWVKVDSDRLYIIENYDSLQNC